MLILYVILVLCTLALLWAAGAAYVRVRRHLAKPHAVTAAVEDVEPEQESGKP